LIEQPRQVLAELGQFIFDPRWDYRKDLAPHQAIALKHAQRVRQHFRRNAFELARQFAVAQPAPAQRADHQIDPFAGEHFKHGVRGARPLVIADRPAPSPKAGEVLIRVGASGINPVNGAVRAGRFPLLGEPPFILGWDVSGTVEALGSGVIGLKVGDAVFGMPRFPKQAAAYAELAAVPADEIAPKPKGIDHLHAAALPLAGLTAWQGLVRHGGLEQGQRVLIHAAAGGVGHLAVQIAKARGAHVVATASPEKLDFVRSLGADGVIDYTKDDFVDKAHDIDLVLDMFGGDLGSAR
jgi:NADPH:quinone reductase-like Zn-dependent oxidoreductase